MALASYRRLLRLLPRRDRRLADEQLSHVLDELAEAERGGGVRRLLVVALRCHLDLARRSISGRAGGATGSGSRGGLRALADSAFHDLRHALRSVLARPLLSGGIVLTLAIGIGANAALFALVDTILHRPLPFADDHELVRIYQMRDNGRTELSPRTPLFLEVQQRARSFEGMAAQRYTTMTLTTSDGPERVIGGALTPGWMELLGVRPAVGRGFSPAEQEQGRESGVVVLGHGFWRERLGGDPAAVGRAIVLDGQPFAVVGILPSGFAYPYANDLYFPLDPRGQADARWALNIQARLRDGVDFEEANRELAELGAELAGGVDGFGEHMRLIAVPTREVLLDDGEGLATGLLGAVGFLLLIACANVGALLLARSSERAGEMELRAALGAPRGRQIRLVLTEGLVLALTAAAAGSLVAVWTRNLLHGLIPGRLVNLVDEVAFDGTTILFAFGLAAITGLLFSLPLALRSFQPAAGERRRTAGGSDNRLLDLFVVAELGLVLALLGGAGALIADLDARRHADFGFDPEEIMTVTVSLSGERYAEPERRRAFADRVIEQLRALPGVREAGATTIFPTARRGGFLGSLRADDAPEEEAFEVNTRIVTPGFIETLGLELRQGRLLSDADRADTEPVALLAENTARRLFGSESAVGRRLAPSSPGEPPIRVVGVVSDVVEQYEVAESWYIPYAQHADIGPASTLILAVRTDASAEGAVADIRRSVTSVDPTLPVFRAASARELREEPLGVRSFGSRLAGVFALVGLLLGAVGLYSLVAFGVARRRRAIAVRIAIGARPGEVVREVLRGGLARVAAGAALGAVGGFLLVQWIGSLVPGVSLEPTVLAGATSLLAAVGLAACWLPARRAARLDPVDLLRSE